MSGSTCKALLFFGVVGGAALSATTTKQRVTLGRVRPIVAPSVAKANFLALGAELELRELHSYLRDAIRLLPDRHRLVVVGSFLEGRTSQELADFLGVTVSRISQLRSEALLMLQEGIDAQYAGELSDPSGGSGRVARRKATFAEGIATASAFADRMEEINLIESDAPALTARMT